MLIAGHYACVGLSMVAKVVGMRREAYLALGSESR